jgi:hypothetical protein
MKLSQKQIETKTRIELMARLLGVNPVWAVAIAMVESSLGLHQVSSTGCSGVFQMSGIAMKDLLQSMKDNDEDLVDIVCGVLFLRLLLKRHKTIEKATETYCDPNDRHFYFEKVKGYMEVFDEGNGNRQSLERLARDVHQTAKAETRSTGQ